MSKIDFVVRENGMNEMFNALSETDLLITNEILENYPYIVNSIKKEKYHIENDLCFIFDEILFENKVVGFATYELRNDEDILLSECYILPEFRGNRLFFYELCKMIAISPKFGILQPTKNIVELLVSYAFAKNVTDDIVVSGIEFYFDGFDIKSNKRNPFDELPISNFYDLGIASTIFVDDDEVFYHCQLENDLINYGLRKNITEDYFKSIIELFSKNYSQYTTLIDELKDELPQENLGYNEIIGDSEDLSEYMQIIVDNELISYDEAFEIKKQLIKEYESCEIDDNTIEDRCTTLISEKVMDKGDFNIFKKIIESSDEDDVEMDIVKDFMDIIGDNEELGNNLINSLMSDDRDEFENLIMNAMGEDEEFLNKFIDLTDEYDDENDKFLDSDDLNGFGFNLDSKYPVAEMMWGSDDDKYKLDDTFYGKDYPISHDIYIFRILETLKKTNDLQFAFATADMRGNMTQYAVENLMFEMNLINDEVTYDNWDEFANNSLTVSDLKDILRENNLKVSGKKQVLIDRIVENKIPLNEFKSPKVSLTQEGEEFLKNNKMIKFYDRFLNKFEFNDYLKYQDENEGELIDITLNYLNEHLKLAKEMDDVEYINECLKNIALISEIGEIYLEKENL